MALGWRIHAGQAFGQQLHSPDALRDRVGVVDDGPVLDLHTALRGNPSIGWNIEEAATVDHVAPTLGHRRHAEFHSAGQRRAVPRGVAAAVVLLPDSKPR